MVGKLLRLVAILFQGFTYLVLTPLTGALIGAGVPFAAHRTASVVLGAKIGGAIGALLALVGLTTVFSESLGLLGFLGWWVAEILVPLLAAGIAVWSFFPLAALVASQPFKAHLSHDLRALVAGLLALFVTFPVSLAILRTVLGSTAQEFLAERVVSGGIQTFEQVLERARSIGAHRPFGRPGRDG